MQNVLVEALPVHVRQLIDFFWNDRKPAATREPADAFAADYFDPGEWADLRPDRTDALNVDFWRKVGWGVVHITYGRAHVTPEQKQWEPVTIGHALAPVVVCFLDNVDPAKLDADGLQHMRACVERFLAAVK